MRVRIRYYGRFVTLLDKFEEWVELPKGAKVKDLIAFLRTKYPQLEGEHIEVSVNGRYASEDARIEAEEIAVYPIVSGG